MRQRFETRLVLATVWRGKGLEELILFSGWIIQYIQMVRKSENGLDRMVHAYNPSTPETEKEPKFKSNLGYKVRLCLKPKQTNNTKNTTQHNETEQNTGVNTKSLQSPISILRPSAPALKLKTLVSERPTFFNAHICDFIFERINAHYFYYNKKEETHRISNSRLRKCSTERCWRTGLSLNPGLAAQVPSPCCGSLCPARSRGGAQPTSGNRQQVLLR